MDDCTAYWTIGRNSASGIGMVNPNGPTDNLVNGDTIWRYIFLMHGSWYNRFYGNVQTSDANMCPSMFNPDGYGTHFNYYRLSMG